MNGLAARITGRVGLAVEELGSEEEQEAPDGEEHGDGHLPEAAVHGQRIAAGALVLLLMDPRPSASSAAASFSPLPAHACTADRPTSIASRKRTPAVRLCTSGLDPPNARLQGCRLDADGVAETTTTRARAVQGESERGVTERQVRHRTWRIGEANPARANQRPLLWCSMDGPTQVIFLGLM
jgi:hypothetical protein